MTAPKYEATPITDEFYAEVYKGRDGEWITLTPDSKAWGHARTLELKVYALRDLLRDEFNRGHRLDSPWDCVEPDCPGFKQPMRKSCGCYQNATKAHIAKVLKEINQS